jgi:O-antigen/teichoic acid export membrane protein
VRCSDERRRAAGGFPAFLMSAIPARAVTAARWRALQLAGVNILFFLRLLILARLLAPDAFGTIAVANVAIGVIMKLSNVGIIPALTYRGAASDAERDAAWTASLLRAIGVTIVLVLAGPWIAQVFRVPAAASILQVLALRTILDAAVSIGLVQLTRELRLRRIALMYISSAVVDLVVAVSLARVVGVWALVLGSLAGAAFTLVASYAVAPHRPRLHLHLASIAPLARYGRWVLLTGIIALAGTTLTQMALSRNLGAAALGVYFLATKIAFIPTEGLAQILGNVAFPMFATMRDDRGRIAEAFRTLVSGQLLLIVPLYALVFVLAKDFEVALGNHWAGIAPVLQILAVAAIVGTFGDVIHPLLMGTGRPHAVVVIELVQTGILLLVLLPLIDAFGIGGAALAWLVGNSAAFVLCLVLFRRYMPGERPWWTLQVTAAVLASAAGAMLAAFVARAMTGIPALIVAATAGLLVVIALLMSLDRVLGLRFGELLRLLRARTAES